MRTVAIFGVGLIGGSFALALKKAGFKGEIVGVSSDRTIADALSRGAIDRGAGFERAAQDADLLYLASPIEKIKQDIGALKGLLKPDALVTDAGSTKSEIMMAAAAHLPEGSFLGGHPMAGKESRGVLSADANLFQGRPYILTPTRPQQMESAQVRWLLDWVRKTGANPLVLPAEQHDRAVALLSHLPQLASSALAVAASRNLPDQSSQKIAGPGFQDMSRLALSPFDMWRDILGSNSKEIDAALGIYIELLVQFRASLADPAALQPVFEEASAFRKSLFHATMLTNSPLQ